MAGNVLKVLTLIKILIYICDSTPADNIPPPSFRNDYFVVTLDLQVNSNQFGYPNALSELDKIPFYEVISSRFSTVMINITDYLYEKNTSVAFSPTAVARFNLAHQNGRKISAWLYVQRSISNNTSYSEQCDHLVEIADKANNIYPGTVTTFLFYDYQWFNRSVLARGKSNHDLRLCKEQISVSNPNKYKTGLILKTPDWLDMLGNEIEDQKTFENVDLILLQQFPSKELQRYDLNKFFPIFQTNYELLKKNVVENIRQENIQFGILTGWSDSGGSGATSNQQRQWTQLTTYWQKMNKWAVDTNTPVVFMQAFDTPVENNALLKTAGWWRIYKDSPFSGNHKVSDYYILEKWQSCCRSTIKVDNKAWENRKIVKSDSNFSAKDIQFPLKLIFVIFWCYSWKN